MVSSRSKKWLRKWFLRQIEIRSMWGYDYDMLKGIWTVNVTHDENFMARSYGENKRRLLEAMDSIVLDNITNIQSKDLIPLFPRDSGDLSELKQTIREKGVIEPLIVRPAPDGKYEIVCGYRRWKAVTELRLTGIPLPCIIKELSIDEAYQLNAIENTHRKDWTPIEEGKHYYDWKELRHKVEKDIAMRIKKSQEYVSVRINLYKKLTQEVQNQIATRRLSIEHGRALFPLADNPQAQRQLAERAIANKWTHIKLRDEVNRITETREAVERPVPMYEVCRKIRKRIDELVNFCKENEITLDPLACRECCALNVCKMAQEEPY